MLLLKGVYIMSENINRFYGAIYSDVDIRDYKMVCMVQQHEFPEEFELKTIRVKDQGTTGSCDAHALASIIEYYNSIQRNDTTDMSVEYIY